MKTKDYWIEKWRKDGDGEHEPSDRIAYLLLFVDMIQKDALQDSEASNDALGLSMKALLGYPCYCVADDNPPCKRCQALRAISLLLPKPT